MKSPRCADLTAETASSSAVSEMSSLTLDVVFLILDTCRGTLLVRPTRRSSRTRV
nr:hypothetical protein JVH1_3965 [Rhodococcus sp. JVH1]